MHFVLRDVSSHFLKIRSVAIFVCNARIIMHCRWDMRHFYVFAEPSLNSKNAGLMFSVISNLQPHTFLKHLAFVFIVVCHITS